MATFSSRTISCLIVAVIIVCIIKIIFFSIYPLYPDEIYYRLISTRFFLDDHVRITTWPLCGPSYALAVPGLVKIPAYFLSLLSRIDQYFYFRVIGVCILMSSVVLLFFSEKNLNRENKFSSGRGVWCLISFILTFATFSPSSVALVMMRGEYILFFSVPLLLFFLSLQSNKNLAFKIFIYLLVFLLFTSSAYVHPKTLFFIPFFAGFIFLFFDKIKIGWRILMFFPFLIFSKQIISMDNLQLLSCPNIPELSNFNAGFVINPIQLLFFNKQALQEFFSNNTFGGWLHFVGQNTFSLSSDASVPYFPLHLSSGSWQFFYKFLFSVSDGFIFSCVSILAFLFFVMLGIATISSRVKKQCPKKILILSGVGIFCTLAHLMCNRSQAFYDFATWTYLFSIFVSFGLLALFFGCSEKTRWAAIKSSFVRWFLVCVLSMVAFCNIASGMLFFDGFFLKMLQHQWTGVGVSVTRSFEADQNAIDALLPRCGVITKNSRFIVDDNTYQVLQQYRDPVPITWLWFEFDFLIKRHQPNIAVLNEYPLFWGMTLNFMKQNNITAVVAACPTLAVGVPSQLLVVGKTVDGTTFCCVRSPNANS